MLPALLVLTLTKPDVRSVESLVAIAWRDADEQKSQGKAAEDEKRHQDDMKTDREVGKKYAAEVDKELKATKDKAMQERVERIGKEMAAIANATHANASWGDKRMNTFDYTFKVVEDKDVNAFSLPGGYIYVYDGLLKFAESDDEIAGVLAHEIAHAAFRHVATLQREQSKLTSIQLPLILLAIFTGGASAAGTAIQGSSLLNQAVGSGWSVKAEQAADYGGFQYMLKSKYDPTGMLTFMERLAVKERQSPLGFELGIFQTHPPSRERADALMARMRTANLPIRRSKVASSFRVESKPAADGTVQLTFGGRPLVLLAGADATSRAGEAVERLNTFFDSLPEVYEVKVGEDGEILGRRENLITLTEADAAAGKSTLDSLQTTTLGRIRNALFNIGYRVWDAR